MEFLNSFLIVESNNRSKFQIILWWELRRVVYNVIVLLVGMFSLWLLSLLVETKPGEDLVEPLAIIGFGLICNLFYTLGWLTEIGQEPSTSYGPNMFKLGLCFTVIVELIPPLFNLIALILT